MRDQLVSALTTALSTLTQFQVSQELPWSQNALPLFRKNMKKVYVDKEYIEQTPIFEVFVGDDVFRNDYICNAYLSVDAKNPPSQTNQAISKILSVKSNTGIINFGVESDYTVSIDEDVQTYTFEFRMNVATI